MSFLFKLIMKIKNITILSILSIFCGLIMLGCVIGFFVLPFIVYSSQIKDVFFGVWCICVIEFFIEMMVVAKGELKENKKEIEEYKKDKVVYWFLRISALLSFICTFLLVFVKRNYQFPISVYGIIFVFVCFLVFVAIVSNLLSIYKNKYKKMVQDGALLFLCLFCLLCISAGIMAYDDKSLAAKILIGFGAVVLLIVGIRYVFKFLLSIEKINTISSSIILFIIIGVLGGIILRYVITDCKLQEILTAIFAAVVGGAITLGGVAWTIKDTAKNRQDDLEKKERDRKEDEKKKNVPYLFIDGSSTTSIKILIESGSYGLGVRLISDAIFIFQGAFLDDKFIKRKILIPPKSFIHITLNTLPYNRIALVGSDILGNYYQFQLELYNSNATKFVKTVGLPIALTEEEKKIVEKANE